MKPAIGVIHGKHAKHHIAGHHKTGEIDNAPMILSAVDTPSPF